MPCGNRHRAVTGGSGGGAERQAGAGAPSWLTAAPCGPPTGDQPGCRRADRCADANRVRAGRASKAACALKGFQAEAGRARPAAAPSAIGPYRCRSAADRPPAPSPTGTCTPFPAPPPATTSQDALAQRELLHLVSTTERPERLRPRCCCEGASDRARALTAARTSPQPPRAHARSPHAPAAWLWASCTPRTPPSRPWRPSTWRTTSNGSPTGSSTRASPRLRMSRPSWSAGSRPTTRSSSW